MSSLDWIILLSTLLSIVLYGSWKTRKNNNLNDFLKGDNSANWTTIGLSIMATQASAITFLSTPGQAYSDGMGFIQFYFGLPIAMVLISIFFLPKYYKLNVFTAYQYLENRFDGRVRSFTAFLFLLSRGLAAGITIYAPAIILSSLLDWNLQLTCLFIGALVIVYTVSGGSKAVSLTQKWQMGVIMIGMFIAFYYIMESIPDTVGFSKSMDIAGLLGKMNIISTKVDFTERYNLLSGILGGVFLFLSYFGTDQSQVQRYLGGKSLKESRMGLMFNGLLKIPMQFFILFVGVMLFVSFQFNDTPIIFNQNTTKVSASSNEELKSLASTYEFNKAEKKALLMSDFGANEEQQEQIKKLHAESIEIRKEYKEKLTELDPAYQEKDSDYIFLSFVMEYLPHGLIGLLLAVIFSAAMSSTAGELNALASTTTIDFYKKYLSKSENDKKDLKASKWLTVIWGIIAIIVSLVAGLAENLIQLVNILGSLFYGTILGVFLVAFFFKKVQASSVLYAGILGQLAVFGLHLLNVYEVITLSYLHYNIFGSLLVVFTALILHSINNNKTNKQQL